MRYVLTVILSVFTLSAAGADSPMATVTGRLDGEDQLHKDGRDTTAMGLAVATFGSARLEFSATKERWDNLAQSKNHVRVRFTKPMTLTAQTSGGKGKTYIVDEILIDTTPFAKRPPMPTLNGKDYIAFGDKVDPGLEDSMLIRTGNKYLSFIKYDGMLVMPLLTAFGPQATPAVPPSE